MKRDTTNTILNYDNLIARKYVVVNSYVLKYRYFFHILLSGSARSIFILYKKNSTSI